jgi:Mrp family chromosome partitioning ATPase
VAQTPGLAEVVTGACSLNDAVIQAQQLPQLHILPAGSASGNPAELLDSSLWRNLMSITRTQFRHIIIDTPPLGGLADYDLIQAVSDGAILVARPDHTDRELCLKALRTIPKDKFLGLVLNCVESWVLNKTRKHAGYYGYYQTAPTAPA